MGHARACQGIRRVSERDICELKTPPAGGARDSSTKQGNFATEANRMGNRFTTLVAAVVLLIAAAPAMAHHGDGSTFGGGSEITMKATVTEWFWANPHCLLKFDVKGDDGQVQHWVGETQSPATIFAAGWNKFMFKPGDQISVTVRPVKNRKYVGPIDGVVLANGKVMKFGYANRQKPAAN